MPYNKGMEKRKTVILSAYQFMGKFSTKEKSVKFLEKVRWPKGIICSHCYSKRIAKRKSRIGVYQCKDCRKDFSVQTGTIFEKSKIPLKKWLYAAYLLQTARKGVSSLQLSKQIGVTQKTAWFMLHRLREACKAKGGIFSGSVTSDETYFGGEAKNKHKKDKPKKQGKTDKTMVQGIKSNDQLKLFIVNSPDKKTLQGNIAKSVETGSTVMTDEYKGYKGLDKDYNHLTVKHSAGEYVCPLSGASTNDIESVWALMKRGYKGVYHHWSKKHLHRYFDEFSFRLDKGNCDIDTIDRVRFLVQGSVGKRLTYEDLTK